MPLPGGCICRLSQIIEFHDSTEARWELPDLLQLERSLKLATPSIDLTRQEVHMYARVWKLNILPGQVEKFTAATHDMMPLLRRQPGFRGCLVLRSGPGEELEATVVSTW